MLDGIILLKENNINTIGYDVILLDGFVLKKCNIITVLHLKNDKIRKETNHHNDNNNNNNNNNNNKFIIT